MGYWLRRVYNRAGGNLDIQSWGLVEESSYLAAQSELRPDQRPTRGSFIISADGSPGLHGHSGDSPPAL